MSDRLYLHSVPEVDSLKIEELHNTPSLLPFEPYVANGVLYTHGASRINPRWDELTQFASGCPQVTIASWPAGHLLRMWWKWNCTRKEEYKYLDPEINFTRGYSRPMPEIGAVTLLRRQLPRAQSAEEITLDVVSSVWDFVAEHPGDYFFLDIG